MKRPHGQSPGGLQAAPASGALGLLGHLSEQGQIYPGLDKTPAGKPAPQDRWDTSQRTEADSGNPGR